MITYGNENGSQEGVYFIEDDSDNFKTDAEDFLPSGCTVDDDRIIDSDFPSGFPLEYNLERN